MKKRGKALIIVLSCLIALFAVVVFYVKNTSAWAKTLSRENPSLAEVPDGEYSGKAALRMPAGTAAANTRFTVVVRVLDHRYASIEVTGPKNLAGSMSALTDRIVEAQSLALDAISGATVTNIAFLKAVADAVKAR